LIAARGSATIVTLSDGRVFGPEPLGQLHLSYLVPALDGTYLGAGGADGLIDIALTSSEPVSLFGSAWLTAGGDLDGAFGAPPYNLHARRSGKLSDCAKNCTLRGPPYRAGPFYLPTGAPRLGGISVDLSTRPRWSPLRGEPPPRADRQTRRRAAAGSSHVADRGSSRVAPRRRPEGDGGAGVRARLP
jgi:hypothetical protein